MGERAIVNKTKYRVIVGAGYWNLSGVHVFSMNLVRGLCARGIDAHLLMTEQETDLVSLPPDMMPLPGDIPVRLLPLTSRRASWADHWASTVRYVEQHAPCVYLPVCDFRHSCVSPKFSPGVSVVGSIQGDDPIHYEHARRLGPYWDAFACVSDECARRVRGLDPSFDARVSTIPNAVRVPPAFPGRSRAPGEPLRVIYHGVINTWQKRILDVPQILDGLCAAGKRVEITIVGVGPQADELREACRALIDAGSLRIEPMVPHSEVGAMLEQHDAYLLTSRFEGMPHAMLEAMAHGCVPVVSDVASGVGQVVVSGENGFRVPVGDIEGFTTALATLADDVPRRRQMAQRAYDALADGPYNVERMIDAFISLFEHVRDRAETGAFRRPRGTVLPPPAEVDGLSIFPVDHAAFVAEVECLLKPVEAVRSPLVMLRRYGREALGKLLGRKSR